MKVFRRLLKERQGPGSGDRRWLFVPYDQLSAEIGPLAKERPRDLGIVLIENRWQLSRRPFHRQKLAHIIASQRHFALEQAERGVAVRYEVAEAPYREALADVVNEFGALRVMEPAEREMRLDLAPLVRSGALQVTPHEGWLTTREQFRAARRKGPPWRMDAFYRHVRRETGILMRRGKPAGGKYSYDPENRLPWRGTPTPPEPPTFAVGPVEEEVAALIESDFARHPGRLDLEALHASRKAVEQLWAWARRRCLPHFGPYEDAMSSRSRGLFHTRLSAAINLHRLLPARVVAEAEAARISLASREGFIRQVLGWREFVRHVHEESDGFRELPGGHMETAVKPGDGGYARWAGKGWSRTRSPRYLDGGATPCALGCAEPLPPAYWGQESGLACLDRVVADVWREGWSHHITRLVILSGIATMLDVSPRELTDWFWAAYVDSQEWVVEPNVMGMGTFAIGDYMSTKPYVTGAPYVDRMSDFCERCAFSPRRDCPLTHLYWAFLARHERTLHNNPRMVLTLANMRRRSPAKRRADAAVFDRVRRALAEARPVGPADIL